MSLHYEESKILEFYDPTLCQLESDISIITLNRKGFKRYVYRPIVGHDILISQFLVDDRHLQIKHITDEYYGHSQEELSQLLVCHFSWYMDTNWTPFADKMSKYVRDMNCEGEHFRIEADEGIGKLYVMNESRGWPNSFWRNDNIQQRTNDLCTVCQENLPDEEVARLGLPCCHVFHKVCLTQWIWSNGNNCPTCRQEF